MMDWTDRHCRAFHRLLAPDALLYTEMVHAQAVMHGDRERLLGFDPCEHPVALQLGGSVPSDLAAASALGAAFGYDEINLNVGCPSDRVQAGRFGACLMLEPGLVADCVAAMAAAVAVPVTVKCRLGVDRQDDYAQFRHFIDTVAAAGCRRFIVHARNAWLQGLSPKENRCRPPLRYDWAYRLKRERPDLMVVLNGGLDSLAAVDAALTQVDAVMLGRAAYHEPYLLHLIDRRLAGAPVTEDRAALLRAFAPYVRVQLERGVPLRHIARHVLGLFNGWHGARGFRAVLAERMREPGADWGAIESALARLRRAAAV